MEKLPLGNLARSSLPFIVKDKIERVIQNKRLIPGSKLPTETELAQMLGISRSSLRDALRILETDGIIIRRHGIGTFIREGITQARNPLEINFGVTEIIESMGLKPGTLGLEVEYAKSDENISNRLGVDKKSQIVIIKRVRTANEKPVVYTIDYLSTVTIGEIYIPSDYRGSVYKLLLEKYNQKISYGVAKIFPTISTVEVAKLLKIKRGSCLLLIEQVDYNLQGLPVMYSKEYWRDIVEFTIFRKRQ